MCRVQGKGVTCWDGELPSPEERKTVVFLHCVAAVRSCGHEAALEFCRTKRTSLPVNAGFHSF